MKHGCPEEKKKEPIARKPLHGKGKHQKPTGRRKARRKRKGGEPQAQVPNILDDVRDQAAAETQDREGGSADDRAILAEAAAMAGRKKSRDAGKARGRRRKGSRAEKIAEPGNDLHGGPIEEHPIERKSETKNRASGRNSGGVELID